MEGAVEALVQGSEVFLELVRLIDPVLDVRLHVAQHALPASRARAPQVVVQVARPKPVVDVHLDALRNTQVDDHDRALPREQALAVAVPPPSINTCLASFPASLRDEPRNRIHHCLCAPDSNTS